MVEFFLEIRSEEIPARMQVRAGTDLQKALVKGLEAAGLTVENTTIFTGPRRLVFAAHIPVRSPDVSEERKGPRVGSPEQALAGFMKAAGLSDISEAEVRTDPKKGTEFYVAVIEKAGRDSADILAELIPSVMADFPWPKSMKSGGSTFRWVRPLRGIVALLDGKLINIEVGGIKSGNQTFGHRQHGPGHFTVTGLSNYQSQLEGAGHVILDHTTRKTLIAEQAHKVCGKLTWVEDEGLLNEVAGLVEWPVVLLGDMDERFLALPEDVIRLTLKSHQKTFTVRGKDGKLAPHFIIVANLDAPDGGATIKAGNAKVISARLSDAQFFIDEDAKTTLAEHGKGLERVVFHDKLRSYADKVERVAALAREIAPHVGADPDKAEEAARLCKNDLVTGTVIEMTSLQGQVGRMMAEREGIDPDVTRAIEEHYKPQGPSDAVPTEPISVAVALADKLDSLVAFWAIDEKPTGSKDPYALRRAALGVVRIVLENNVRGRVVANLVFIHSQSCFHELDRQIDLDNPSPVSRDLLIFILDRLRGVLRDQGHRHDIIDAVISDGGDDLLAISQRVEALGTLLDTEDGTNLVAGYKRAANILRAERKKGKLTLPAFDSLSDFTAPEATALYGALAQTIPAIDAALDKNAYPDALSALAALRGPIDAFFEGVMVNSENSDERLRRLSLLEAIVATAHRIADFSRLDG